MRSSVFVMEKDVTMQSTTSICASADKSLANGLVNSRPAGTSPDVVRVLLPIMTAVLVAFLVAGFVVPCSAVVAARPMWSRAS